MLTNSTCEAREVALERHQHEAVEATGTLEIHRVHDMRHVGGVLPLGMDESLVRDDGESFELLSPAARSRAGEVAAQKPDPAGDVEEKWNALAGMMGLAGQPTSDALQ